MSYFGDKPSSRVLRPPGGGSSDIFCRTEEPVMAKKNLNSKPTFQSSVFEAGPEPTKPRPISRSENSSSKIFGTDNDNNNVTTTPKKISKTHQSSVFSEAEATLPDDVKKASACRNPITGIAADGDSSHECETAGDKGNEENLVTSVVVDDSSPRLGPVKNTSGVRCAQPPGGKSSISFG